MGEVMLSIGAVNLSVSSTSYARLKRSTAWRWPAQNPIGHPPRLESLGPGRDTVLVDGTLYPAHRPGGGALEALRALAGERSGHLVVSGDGAVHGRWAVTQLDETHENLFADGRARKIKWSLTLEFSGEELSAGELSALEARSDPAGSPRRQVDAASSALAAGDSGRQAAARVAATHGPTSAQQSVRDAAMAAEGDGASAVRDAVEAAAATSPPVTTTAPAHVAAAYRASAGETLADVARKQYGTSEAVVDLLAANRRWQLSPRLAAGDLVALPDRATIDLPRAVEELVTLWS
ncbi:MAG: phage tail protein [Rhodospirillales bacterium]|nr:phage tail protein [Rhodospirillales bacterium]